jgi:hypothetical protein
MPETSTKGNEDATWSPKDSLAKKRRKASIEKSLEFAFQKFKETSNEDFERYTPISCKRYIMRV